MAADAGAGSVALAQPDRRGGAVPDDLYVRGLLVLLAAVAVAAGAPAALAGPLTTLAAAATLERVVRRPDRSGLDALVLGTGGLLVALIALGFLLDRLPPGLTRVPWAAGAGLLALGALATCHRRPCPPYPRPGTRRLAAAGWYAAAAVLVATAVTMSVRGTHSAERPPLALSAQDLPTGAVDVLVTAGTSGGRYRLLVARGPGRPAVRGPFTVAAGSTVHHALRVPAGQRITVSLVAPGSTRPLRTLVLQGPGALGSGATSAGPSR